LLDLASIMFTTLMMIYVVVRAVHLDQTVPWFPVTPPKKQPDAASRTGYSTSGTQPPWRHRH